MREILFKAKRIDTGEWVEGLITIMWGQYHIINPNDENTAYQIDTSTICQYTGLTDKSGNKIWENDVVRYSWTDGQDEAETEVITVNYDNYGYTPYIWECDCDGCCLRCETLEVESIGNIFDNPELAQLAAMQMRLKKYLAIGTIEEFKTLKEKSVAKIGLSRGQGHESYLVCPTCNSHMKDDQELWNLDGEIIQCKKCKQLVLIDWQ